MMYACSTDCTFMNSKKTMESSVISLKYFADHLADSSLLKGLFYERIPLCKDV